MKFTFNDKGMSICIAPAKQTATIRQGKKVLKRYNFKTKIPFVIESKEVETYDYSNWCVSDRDGTRTVKIKVFCDKSIQELKNRILEYYLTTIN